MIPAMYVTAKPTIVAFAGALDRLNLLKPNELAWSGANATTTQTELAANYINLWTKGNPAQIPFPNTGVGSDVVSFSAPVAAPDGTLTAYAIVESNDGGTPRPHFITAGCTNCQGSNQPKHSIRYRWTGIGRVGTRTRFKLELSHHIAAFVAPRKTGASVIFDLAGGQATTPVVFGTFNEPITGEHLEWTDPVAMIVPFLGPWYLCSFSALGPEGSQTTMNGALAVITMDSGSGLAAESTSYAAPGGDTIYFWQTRMLPAGAETLDTRTFFDDFDSTSTIDLTYTKAVGFNWYTQYKWPSNKDYSVYVADPSLLKLPASSVSVSSSVLTIADPTSAGNTGLMSFCWDETGTPDASGAYPLSSARGTLFQAPGMFEIKSKWNDVPLAPNAPPLGPVFWLSAAELLLQKDYFNPDTTDAGSVYGPNFTISATANAAAGTSVLTFAYVPLFFRKVGARIRANNSATAAGTRVQSATSTTITLDTPLVAPGVAIGDPIHISWYFELDFYEENNNLDVSPAIPHIPARTQHDLPGHYVITSNVGPSNNSSSFHLYQTLWLSIGDGGAFGGADLGVIMNFRDGVYFSNTTMVYGSTFDALAAGVNVGYFDQADSLHMVMHIGGQTQWPHDVDYVAVYGT